MPQPPPCDLGDHPVGRGVARVDDVEVGVGAVAAGRAVADPAAVMAPGAELVAAAAVGEQAQPAAGERVELEEFVAADVLLDAEHVAGRATRSRRPARPRSSIARASPIGMATRWSWAVLPNRVVISIERSRGVPAGEARGAELHIGPGPRGELGRDRRHAVGDQRRGLLHRRRVAALRERRGQRQERSSAASSFRRMDLLPFCDANCGLSRGLGRRNALAASGR